MALFSSLFNFSSQYSDKIHILDVPTFKAHLKEKNIQLIDVRTPREFLDGHIANARNLDYFNQSRFKEEIEKLDKTEPIYLYCRSGNRSQKAARILVDSGFEKIYDLKGGFMQWS